MTSNGVQVLRKALLEARAPSGITPDHTREFVTRGRFTVRDAFPAGCVPIIRQACVRAMNRPLPVTRKALDPPGWINVDRATLFRYPVGVDQRLHSMRWLAPELLVVAQWTDYVSQDLARKLREIGQDDVAAIMQARPSARVVINRMNGTLAHPAVIADHEDRACERDANIVAEIEPTRDSITGEERQGNGLTFFASRNVTEPLGIVSELHGVTSDCERFSAVFTNSPRIRTEHKGLKVRRDVLGH